mmetsp:Transcript_13635/g.15817  ORF Transcript_13635/g.15817 Transcript_13635/m.15817 type:complete len:165 (+) Transcript_13635:1-495(+)
MITRIHLLILTFTIVTPCRTYQCQENNSLENTLTTFSTTPTLPVNSTITGLSLHLLPSSSPIPSFIHYSRLDRPDSAEPSTLLYTDSKLRLFDLPPAGRAFALTAESSRAVFLSKNKLVTISLPQVEVVELKEMTGVKIGNGVVMTEGQGRVYFTAFVEESGAV